MVVAARGFSLTPGDDRGRKARADAVRAREATRSLYGTARWQAIRQAQFAASPVCVKCEEMGRVTPAAICDHREPHRGDVARFWAGPFDSLCKPCHDRVKQAEEGQVSQAHPGWLRPSRVPLTVVCGAPGAGKAAHVAAAAGAGDLIIDLDVMIRAALAEGGVDRMMALNRAMRARNAVLGKIGKDAAIGRWPAAWLIVGEPDAVWRQWWIDTMAAVAVVVVETPADVCASRLMARPGVTRTQARALADGWWSRYRRREGDLVVAGATV